MKRPLPYFMLFCLLLLSLLNGPVSLATTVPPGDPSLAPMLKKVMPAIVNIRGTIKITNPNILRELERQKNLRNDNTPIPNSVSTVGSGVIIDAAKGYIVTNAHVVKDAQTIMITLSDSRHFTAKVVGSDPGSDIALLQIKATNLTAVTLGDYNKLNVGDYVAAIGNPFGLNQSVTSGIVSGLGRNTLGIENYESFIQTDAPINPGNSGGALINMQGQLVGINTAILAPNQGSIGIGFAIPVNMMKSVVDQLIRFGDVKRGMLGIGAQDLTSDLASAFSAPVEKGAAVTQVLPGSPAATAGFQVGDIITNINGTPIKNASDVVNTVGFLRVDTKVNVELLRKNAKLTLNVALTDAKQREKNVEKVDPFLYGLTIKNFSALSPLHGPVQGVLVLDVQEDSNAWQSDVRSGDVITSVNQQRVGNVDELKAAVAKSGESLLLNVIRGPSAIFLVVNKPAE